MSKFTRPTFNVDDDDLERLQKEFFDKEQMPSAKVYRKSAPTMVQPQKKPSLFAERLNATSSESATSMPALEDPTMPALEDPSMPALQQEPVMESHVPAIKKMIDLTSLLGKVLGDITEHQVQQVKAPSLPVQQDGKTARGQAGGFPKPVHRSEFKKRLEAQRATRPNTPPPVESSDENDQRIDAMTPQEIEDARQEIMSMLSPESIALLMNKKKQVVDDVEDLLVKKKKQVSFEDDDVSQKKKQVRFEDDDLSQMKEQYFADVPVEHDKLAWMDPRPKTQNQEENVEATEAEKVYRKLRFDLQGHQVDPTIDIPRHKGLHHHGDEPDKAGYTLAELFYLARSQVPSQRSMVLTTLGRIIKQAKLHYTTNLVWAHVLTVFTGKEHASTIYLRSALDDRHLIVLVSAIGALAALVLEEDEDVWEASLLEAGQFNQFLGHIVRPMLPRGTTQIQKKGLNDKLTELVDRVRQTSGQQVEQQRDDDAALAERDLVRGLIKMDILPRLRYLLGSDSELMQQDPASVERLVRILVRMAQAGPDVCDLIDQEGLLTPILDWGIDKTQWPMLNKNNVPSLGAVRLLTVLAQGSKQIAEKVTITLRFLVTSPETACDDRMKQRAYALQLETLKLMHVLACYGFIVPTLKDLHGPMMTWLRCADSSALDATRAAMAIGLFEVLLHAAADPHTTTPAHAIDWHQPTAYLPAIVTVLCATRHQELYESALGYLGAWASHVNRFPPSDPDVVGQVWEAVANGHSVALGYTTHHVLRYIQFIVAYASLNKNQVYRDAAQARLKSVTPWLKKDYQKDLLTRYAFWLWLGSVKEKEASWVSLGLAELESGIRGARMGTIETWLAQGFLKLCLDTKTLGGLGAFYFKQEEDKVDISKAIFAYDGRLVKTFMYTSSMDEDDTVSALETTAFILSPIDQVYHLDKSAVAQKSRDDAATVVANTMALAKKLFDNTMDHEVAIISLMKVFLIGDREGRQADLDSEQEIFWDERVSNAIHAWLDDLCRTKTNVSRLEHAWRRSSEYIRQSQVPFFQFYQGFVAQYAAVSFGHHGFARLLVYLVTQIDTIDYRHLLLSDYRDILPTIKVGVNQVPPLDVLDLEQLTNAGLKLLD